MKQTTIYTECKRDEAHIIGSSLPEDELNYVYLKSRTISEEGLEKVVESICDNIPGIQNGSIGWEKHRAFGMEVAKSLMEYINGKEDK